MTHEHKDGCCGSHAHSGENKASCCVRSGWVTGLAVVVAVVSLGYALTVDKGGVSAAKPKVDTASLITGEDTVIAKVNGETVRKSDVALAIRELGANVPPENIDQILPAFVDQYINLKLINEAAEKEGVAKDEEVQVQLANSREQIIRAAYLRKLFDGKLDEEAVKAAYKARFEDQPMPEEVRARHILVDDEGRARDLIAQLARGANFEKLASENSKDPSARQGGDLGYFTQGEMVKEFGDAAFAMRPGQTSQEPVRTQFGYHVIRVEDKRQRAKPSYEEARQGLEQEARQAMLDAKLTELRAKAKIELVQPEGAANPIPASGTVPAPAGLPDAGAPAAAPAPVQ